VPESSFVMSPIAPELSHVVPAMPLMLIPRSPSASPRLASSPGRFSRLTMNARMGTSVGCDGPPIGPVTDVSGPAKELSLSPVSPPVRDDA